MKILDVIKSANSNLARNKVRTTLTIIAIFVGAFTLALTTGIDTGVNRYIDAQLGNVGGENTLAILPKPPEALSGGDDVVEYKPTQANSSKSNSTNDPNAQQIDTRTSGMGNITEKTLQKIRDIEGIESSNFINIPKVDYITSLKTDKKYVIDLSEIIPGVNIDMEEGQAPSIKDNSLQISLEPRFVQALGFASSKDAINQPVTLGVTNQVTKQESTIKATITGVQSNSLLMGGNSYVNPALNTEIENTTRVGTSDIPLPHYMAAATMKEGLSEEKISQIKNQISDIGFRAQTVDDQIGSVRSVINAVIAVLTMFAAIALVAASFGIINTLYMAVQERTREIGLLKAMGLSSGKVFVMFSLEAILIGFWGSMAGIVTAMLAGHAINAVAKDSFLSNLTGFTLIQFSWHNIILITLIICIVAFLAGTLPAIKASKLNPIEALRYE